MQHLPAPIHHARDAAQLPVAIDYPAALALRQMSMVHDELPKYLLAPEVSALLHYVPDLRRKMLLATLFSYANLKALQKQLDEMYTYIRNIDMDIHKKNRYASYDLRRKIEIQHEEFQKMTEREQVPLLKSPE